MTVQAALAALTGIPERVAATADAIAADVESVCRRTAAAGTTPDGTKWSKTADGKEPLRNAAEHVKSAGVTLGTRVVITTQVKGHYALHDLGRANGAERRQIIPDRMTPAVAEEIEAPVRKAVS